MVVSFSCIWFIIVVSYCFDIFSNSWRNRIWWFKNTKMVNIIDFWFLFINFSYSTNQSKTFSFERLSNIFYWRFYHWRYSFRVLFENQIMMKKQLNIWKIILILIWMMMKKIYNQIKFVLSFIWILWIDLFFCRIILHFRIDLKHV